MFKAVKGALRIGEALPEKFEVRSSSGWNLLKKHLEISINTVNWVFGIVGLVGDFWLD